MTKRHTDTLIQTQDEQSLATSGRVSKLSHPSWVTLVNRIPRAARPSSAALLTEILRRINGSPNNKTAWLELLHFRPVILAKQKRGGSKRNLSNSSTAAWDKDAVPMVHSQTTDSRTSRKSNDNSKLAAAVSSKLEAGNFRAAVQIISSSDTPAPTNQDTLKALRTKHPGPAHDRRTPYDPKDNPRFQALQVSKEDVMKALCTFPLGSSGRPDGITPQHIGTSWRDLQMTASSKHLLTYST